MTVRSRIPQSSAKSNALSTAALLSSSRVDAEHDKVGRIPQHRGELSVGDILISKLAHEIDVLPGLPVLVRAPKAQR